MWMKRLRCSRTEIRENREPEDIAQMIVRAEELEFCLREGWQFVSVLGSQGMLIRKSCVNPFGSAGPSVIFALMPCVRSNGEPPRVSKGEPPCFFHEIRFPAQPYSRQLLKVRQDGRNMAVRSRRSHRNTAETASVGRV